MIEPSPQLSEAERPAGNGLKDLALVFGGLGGIWLLFFAYALFVRPALSTPEVVYKGRAEKQQLRELRGEHPDLFAGLYTAHDSSGVYLVGSVPTERDLHACLLYTSPSPRDRTRSRMPSSA